MLTKGQMLYCVRSAYVSHAEWSDLWNQKGEQSVATRAGGGGDEAYWGQSFDSARRKVLEVCGSPPCIHQTVLTGW